MSVHAERRARLAQAMAAAGGGVAVLANAPERTRSTDSDHPYRHDSNFHYLTGFDEPQAWLLLHASGRSVLLCREKNPEREVWDGARLGPQAAPVALGVDAALPIEALDATLARELADQGAVWFAFAGASEASRIETALAAIRGRSHHGEACPTQQRDLAALLAEMRLVKDATELDTMRRAGTISAGAHVRAMRWCGARYRAEPHAEVPEYEIEAELLHEFRRHGAQSPAYPSIVAAGANACVLHHSAGATRLRAGELCLIDAGCELDGYASDITRTFPANGRFTPAQRELYELVLAAQLAAADATRPGARQRDAHHAAVRVLAQGMLDTRLLDRAIVGDVDAVIDSAAYRRFYMHGTGHWLGRDVHDVGDYLAADEAAFDQSDGLGGRVVRKPSRLLRPGMVVTLEPGLYVRPGEDVPKHFWNLGIRIEDDAVVTASGCELISRGVPVEAAAIEALMRG
ncbi:MAG: aminopeptidase P N-terminal domain-containing protein [Burkholderiaceae bacterium]